MRFYILVRETPSASLLNAGRIRDFLDLSNVCTRLLQAILRLASRILRKLVLASLHTINPLFSSF